MIRPSDNGHAFEYADGTPFFLLGDTWWATPTFRFRWYEDDTPRPLGPAAGFKDYVRSPEAGVQLHRHDRRIAELGQ